jgi:hypothetical protein
MKVCSRCQHEKPLKDFPMRGSKRRGTCRQCLRDFCRDYYRRNTSKFKARKVAERKRIRAWLNDYMSKQQCSECPERRQACLDFHHRDPDEKAFNIGQVNNIGVSLEKLIEEIAKCIILCANCHRCRHFDERQV